MTDCKWTSTTTPRIVPARHEDDLGNDPIHVKGCAGCLVCPERHCRICGISHVTEQTCAACIGAVRTDLADIVRLMDELEVQTVEGSNAKGRLLAQADIPGGDALVLLAGGSDGRNQTREILLGGKALHAHDEHAGDPEPPLQVLASWEDDWRRTFGQPGAPGLATVESATDYLNEHLHRAAQSHDAFDEFAQHIRTVRGRLEDATGYGTGDQRGTSCVHCGGTLVRRAADRVKAEGCGGHGHLDTCPWPRQDCCDTGGVDLDGEWTCSRCKRSYDDQAYRNATRAEYVMQADHLPAADVAARFGITVGTLRVWATRGLVRKRRSEGQTEYDVSDVVRRLGAA